jgi:hypothetical protein
MEKFEGSIQSLPSEHIQAVKQLHDAYQGEANNFLERNIELKLIEQLDLAQHEDHHERNCECLLF